MLYELLENLEKVYGRIVNWSRTKMSECHFDHSFNGSENEIGLRNGEEGPRPPNNTKTPEEIAELERLYGLIVAQSSEIYRRFLESPLLSLLVRHVEDISLLVETSMEEKGLYDASLRY